MVDLLSSENVGWGFDGPAAAIWESGASTKCSGWPSSESESSIALWLRGDWVITRSSWEVRLEAGGGRIAPTRLKFLFRKEKTGAERACGGDVAVGLDIPRPEVLWTGEDEFEE